MMLLPPDFKLVSALFRCIVRLLPFVSANSRIVLFLMGFRESRQSLICPCLFAGNENGAGRLMAGILRRWEERLTGEDVAKSGG